MISADFIEAADELAADSRRLSSESVFFELNSAQICRPGATKAGEIVRRRPIRPFM
jgi:hypothetical protein